MKKNETTGANSPVATIGETQNIILIRANLNAMEKNLPKEKALELAKRIRPVVTQTRNNNADFLGQENNLTGDKYWVDGGQIYNQSYTFLGFDKKHFYAKAENLTQVATLTTYHKCGYPSLLKPSVYEVLYQIPQELRDKVVAFELFASSLYVNDIYDEHIDRHKLTCVLYSGTMPQEVADKEVVW